MATFTNETGDTVVLPTLNLEVAPGETVDIPDPEPPAAAYDPSADTIANVLAWVDDDPRRAALALAAEEQATKPRPRLIEQLAALINPTPEA